MRQEMSQQMKQAEASSRQACYTDCLNSSFSLRPPCINKQKANAKWAKNEARQAGRQGQFGETQSQRQFEAKCKRLPLDKHARELAVIPLHFGPTVHTIFMTLANVAISDI